MKRKPCENARLTILVIMLVMLIGGIAASSFARNNQTNHHNLIEQLAHPVGVVWSESPLRDSLDHLAKSQDVTIWLDRRIDPNRSISLVLSDTSLKDVLARVAKEQNLGICLFQSVIYLGPKKQTSELRTLGQLRREDAENLPPRAAKRFLSKRALRWDDLATPRELLETLARENQLEIVNSQRVVHDLWPAMELPRMALVDRLTLILAPLGLTFQLEDQGTKIRLVDIPEQVFLTRYYPAGPRPKDSIRRWSQLLPEARFRIERDKVVVEASLADHERISRPKRPAVTQHTPPPKKRPGNSKLDRLRIERVRFRDQPLAAVVRKLATQLKLKLKFDTDELKRSGIDVDQLVSLEMKNVTIDELFRALLKPAGLTFRREGSSLEIQAAQP